MRMIKNALHEVWKELCRTRLIYVIAGCALAVMLDFFLFRHAAPLNLPPLSALPVTVIAPEEITPEVPETVAAEPAMPAPTLTAPAPTAAVDTMLAIPAPTQQIDGGLSEPASLPEPPPLITVPENVPPVAVPAPVDTGDKAKIVIVIDDMGVAVGHSREIMALPEDLTLAFLPYAPDIEEQMVHAKSVGKTVMVHMPMEPVGQDNPGPDAIYDAMPADEIMAKMEANLDKALPVAGINNHMGSKVTADADAMDAVMRVLKARHMFFLDSLTTETSAAREAAAKAGVPYIKRDLFLDHYPDEAAVLQALRTLEARAAKQGHAIAIGHPRPATLVALKTWLKNLDKSRFAIVPITDLVPKAETQIEIAPEIVPAITALPDATAQNTTPAPVSPDAVTQP